MRETAGLTKDATLIGVGERVEIWNPETLTSYNAACEENYGGRAGASGGARHMSEQFSHIPVLLHETLEHLAPERGGIFVDGTLGGGGHAGAVLSRLPENGRLIGIDRDWEAVRAAGERLASYGGRFTALHGNFFDMKALLNENGVTEVSGILLDLGVSSHQLDTSTRGFSYKTDAPLDMRMDQGAALSARDVVNTYPEAELTRIFFAYGEERFSKRIAERICRVREQYPIETTLQLAQIVRDAIPGKYRNEPQHPARRTFQALRIEVNGEIERTGPRCGAGL